MPTSSKKPTLASRVQSLEDWAFTPKMDAAIGHSAPDPEMEARRKLRSILDANKDIVSNRILDQITSELAEESVSTLRVANLAGAFAALARSY